MIVYGFIDSDDNIRLLTTIGLSDENQTIEKTFKKIDDFFTSELDVIEKTFTAGADFPGTIRDASKTLTYQYNIHFTTNEEFRNVMNTNMAMFRSTEKIYNMTDNIFTSVRFQSHQITYLDGTDTRMATCTVTFKQLIPYWESYDEITVTNGTGEDSVVVVNNQGKIETPPVITMNALLPTSKILIKILESNTGIYINDLQFGSGGLNQMILDNREGTLELDGLDRKNKIGVGTGFFNLNPGTNTITFDTNGNIDIEITYRERHYI